MLISAEGQVADPVIGGQTTNCWWWIDINTRQTLHRSWYRGDIHKWGKLTIWRKNNTDKKMFLSLSNLGFKITSRSPRWLMWFSVILFSEDLENLVDNFLKRCYQNNPFECKSCIKKAQFSISHPYPGVRSSYLVSNYGPGVRSPWLMYLSVTLLLHLIML